MPVGPHSSDWSRTGVSCRYGCLVAADGRSLAKRAGKRGVRRADLERLVAVTGGICMVCRVCHATVVEHCHNTGRVRGIACSDCNARIGRLEGTTYWLPLYFGGCGCVGRRAGDELLLRLWQLEQATYRFLDHAMEPVTHHRKEAFAWLAEHPYPTGDAADLDDPGRLPPPRTQGYAHEARRMMVDAGWVAYRQRQRVAGATPDSGHWEQEARERIAIAVLAAFDDQPAEALTAVLRRPRTPR